MADILSLNHHDNIMQLHHALRTGWCGLLLSVTLVLSLYSFLSYVWSTRMLRFLLVMYGYLNERDQSLGSNSLQNERRLEYLNSKKGFGKTFGGSNKARLASMQKVVSLRSSWHYSWGPYAPRNLEPQSIQFLPMIWGYWDYDDFVESIEIAKEQNPSLLLAFNEPDREDQANLTVDQAVRVWHDFEAAQIPLVSPSCYLPLGPWMQDFMEQVDQKGLRVDVIGVHSYGGISVRAFKKLMLRVYEKYQRPILVTEFAVADWDAETVQQNRYTAEQVLAFMQEVLPWMESQDWILGYAWFSFSIRSPAGTSSALFDRNGNLTVCGRYYADFGASKGEVLNV